MNSSQARLGTRAAPCLPAAARTHARPSLHAALHRSLLLHALLLLLLLLTARQFWIINPHKQSARPVKAHVQSTAPRAINALAPAHPADLPTLAKHEPDQAMAHTAPPAGATDAPAASPRPFPPLGRRLLGALGVTGWPAAQPRGASGRLARLCLARDEASSRRRARCCPTRRLPRGALRLLLATPLPISAPRPARRKACCWRIPPATRSSARSASGTRPAARSRSGAGPNPLALGRRPARQRACGRGGCGPPVLLRPRAALALHARSGAGRLRAGGACMSHARGCGGGRSEGWRGSHGTRLVWYKWRASWTRVACGVACKPNCL